MSISGPPNIIEPARDGSSLPDTKAALPDYSFAAGLRGFGLVGVFAALVILAGNEIFVPLSAILILVWVAMSRTSWREIGFVRPKNWIATIFIGVVLGVALKLTMKAIVMPLLDAPPINPAYHFLVGNKAALPWMLYLIIVGAGFGEETLFRGWMFERFSKLFGQSVGAKIGIVLITSIWFGLVHYSFQGIPGVQQAFIVGLVFASIFAVTGRLFTLMIAHAAFDLTALALIFWDVESVVAHLVF